MSTSAAAAAVPGAPDPALVAEALRTISAGQGLNRWLGVELLRLETGVAEIAFAIRPEFAQHHGTVHGGVIAAAADIACAWTAASVAGDVVTAGFSIQFLRAARGERLRAAGAALKAGRRHVSVEARVYCEADGQPAQLVAVALASVTPTQGG